MLDMFLPKDKMIVYTKNKAGDITSEYKAKDDQFVKLPMCVLINGNSASASEIFAANVKDHKLGKLVGQTTFGKGIVQTVSRLTDGSAIKFTTAKYFTPSGEDIHKKGIKPDVEIELNTEDYVNKKIDSQLNVAIDQLKKK
jgi:carboxyl-terminal processing protease